MPGSIRSYFRDYVDTREGFELFHNQVINMPRDAFEGTGIQKLQTLASYLSSIKEYVSEEGNDYKQIMGFIANAIVRNAVNIQYRDIDLENRYFNFRDLKSHYYVMGRMFRHLMGLCAFWGIVKSLSKTKKIINFERCKDFLLLEPNQILSFTSNISLDINIKTNDFINSLTGVNINPNANYHPTLGILKYMESIGRDVTIFELSALLGRVDNLQDEGIIIQRALDVGRQFASNDKNGQKQEFFREMGWINKSGALFVYEPSQQPWFKFRTYILFLESFGLIEKKPITGNYSITGYARSLLGDLPASVIDLNKIINKLDLDGGSISDVTMKDILIKTNIDTLNALVLDGELVKKINRFVIANPIEKDGKRYRNQFIAELARIRECYQCQAGTVTFDRQDGRNYVEAHHIIEFAKGGPDILDNLLALGPTPHTQLHRGSDRAIRDMYTHLMGRGAIHYGLFKSMVVEYRCLNASHLDLLYNKGLISNLQRSELLKFI